MDVTSYRRSNRSSETRLILREQEKAYVALSTSEITPQIREHNRNTTRTVNAHIHDVTISSRSPSQRVSRIRYPGHCKQTPGGEGHLLFGKSPVLEAETVRLLSWDGLLSSGSVSGDPSESAEPQATGSKGPENNGVENSGNCDSGILCRPFGNSPLNCS